MSLLLTPVQSIKQRLARRRQMRIALQMLAVSGVLRPGDSELRYTVPLTRKRLGSDLHSRSTSGIPGARQVLTAGGVWAAGFAPSLSRRKYWGSRQLQTGE
ncbi:MAG TPA: hypothetical protein PKA61_13695 [Nitrospira sp.]|nr:hypothetical protein [Nitrospira sp.]